MAITDIGESIQIRIEYVDSDQIKKLYPEEPWYKAIKRLLHDLNECKKQRKKEIIQDASNENM